MKKIKLFVIFGFVCISFVVFFSCNLNSRRIIVDTYNDVECSGDRRLELAELRFLDDYKVSTDEIFEDLNYLLLPNGEFDKLPAKVKSATLDSGYRFTKIRDMNVNFSNYGRSTEVSLKSDQKVEDDIRFSIINVDSLNGEQTGYALVSDDKRIGTVLMYIDDSLFCEDISDDPFMQFIVSSLNNYIEKTKNIWDDIDEDDYEKLKEKYGITDEQIKEARIKNESNIQLKKMFGTSYSPWSKVLIKGPIIKTQWGQSDFNSLVSEVKDECVPVGCGPLALAQIMAYYKHPTHSKFSQYKIRSLVSNYASAYGWDGTYNWNEILLKTKNGRRDGACLLYEIGRRAWTQYSSSGSGTWGPMLSYAARTMGYSISDRASFSFDKIRSSIDENCPVLVEGFTSSRYIGLPFWKWIEWGDGDGHAFICDGYLYQERTKTKYVFWIPIEEIEKNEYVHFNPGWSGFSAGWYKSGVFDMLGGYTNDVDSVTKKGSSSNSNDYSEAVHIWSDIKPKE